VKYGIYVTHFLYFRCYFTRLKGKLEFLNPTLDVPWTSLGRPWNVHGTSFK